MGTPQFAVEPLRRLCKSKRHQVVAVVTQPDKPSGRGREIKFPPVKEFALSYKLPVLQPTKIKGVEYDKVLAPFAPDCIVVAAYGKILPLEVLCLPKYGCINIHASLLPKYRGAAPIARAIVNGERVTGVSIMQMEEGLDTGPVICMDELEIIPDDNCELVTNALSVLGAKMLIDVLDEIEKTGKIKSTPQDDAAATYAPMLKKSDGLMDWSKTGNQLICHIMGMTPVPSAFSYLGGKQLWKFTRAESFKGFEGEYADAEHLRHARHGTVTAVLKGRGFMVKCGDQHLLITEAQPSGKRRMSGGDIVNGNLVKVDDVFLSEMTE